MRDISKRFPGVLALDNVSLSIERGEVHALLGENGAGKSTLMKILSGAYKKDAGEIIFDGQPVQINSPRQAQELGVSIIYQELNLVPQLSVAENIFLSSLPMKNPACIDWKHVYSDAQTIIDSLEVDINVRSRISSLGIAQQQMVEIAKALSTNARIIIMDEPTAALTKNESEELYRITEKLRDDGKSVIFISHRLEDMYRLASRVTVFRDAQYIGTYNVAEIQPPELIKAMVGREVSDLFPKPEVKPGEEVLRVENLSRTGFFRDVSFRVRAGEIVGLTGLVGTGRTEVVQTIFGVEHYDAGKVFVDGKEIHIRRPQDAMRLGIGLLTEDRQNQGLILDWGIGRNITLPELGAKFSKKGGITSETIENQAAKELAEEIDVKAVTVFDPASSLSGGNQQKVVVAKALASDLKLLIMDEPTKGVDVGAKAAIYQIMGELAQKGMAIVMISSEMPELLGMSDRIYVMCDGRVTGELSRTEATQEKILELSMLKHSGAASG